MSGTLYIVATPIGNLEDITLRALAVLKRVDLIACEDTRRTKILLNHYQIKNSLVSFHQHSKIQKIDRIIAELRSGADVALVTDAGTPGISDPGGVLVARCVSEQVTVRPIPGPSALTALVSVAGIPMDQFLFLGFLPHKKGRRKVIDQIVKSEVPVVFYESPYRILKTLAALSEYEGRLIIGRELTKQFEEVVRGTAKEVYQEFESRKIQGEFTVIYYK